MPKSLDFSKNLQNFLIWNEYFGKKNLVQEFMVLGQIFRQVLGSKFCLILYFLKYTCIIYRWIANFLSNQLFVCIQHAKSSIKTISSKIFEQNVDYVKVDQFSTRDFKNNNVSRKIITPSDFFKVKW